MEDDTRGKEIYKNSMRNLTYSRKKAVQVCPARNIQNKDQGDLLLHLCNSIWEVFPHPTRLENIKDIPETKGMKNSVIEYTDDQMYI